MAETRGAATIVDRVEGWGHTDSSDSNREDNDTWGSASGNTVTATDATPEDAEDRFDRTRVARKSGNPGDTPDTDDRSKGEGGTYVPTAGADNGYRTNGPDAVWAAEELEIGEDYDVEYTGSNTALDDEHSETDATNRTADSRNTVDLDDGNATKRDEAERTSILDRTDGWGHTDGSLTYRND